MERSGDKKPDRDRNLKTTAERGQVILTFLLGKGVKPSQIDVTPLGSDYPLDAKNPTDPRVNRRVEVIRVTQYYQ